ncbi:MAG: efflux RND transporter periplasmic adaptor subunit [Flavobacteriales bacterium]|nr:efflux RND transporter periplasmic adaptor subunit [Flavobacteriales bacterium]
MTNCTMQTLTQKVEIKKQISEKIINTTGILIIGILLFSCASKSNTSLEKMIQERDSLKAEHEKINLRIQELNDAIALIDTSKSSSYTSVKTQLIIPETFEHYIEVQGNLQSDKNITLNAEVPGIIKNITINEGDYVTKGQTLALIDAEIIRKNLEEVKTSYALSKTLFEKQESLWKQKIGSEVQYLQAKTQKESLEQRVEALQAQLDKTVIKAPFDGVIDQIFTREGEIANGMLPLMRIVNISTVYVSADVPENYILNVKRGSEAKLEFPSLNEVINTKVTQVASYINPGNRTFKVRFDIPNQNEILKPNLISVVKINDLKIDSSIVISNDIIQQDAKGNKFVFVIDTEGNNKKVQKKQIVLGEMYNNNVRIKEGLSFGDEVVILGGNTVRAGELVQIKNN